MSLLARILKYLRPEGPSQAAWKRYEPQLLEINRLRDTKAVLRGDSLEECFAAAALAAECTLGLRPFDVQIIGALAMADGKIAEMQTGEGKTLAATMAVNYLARGHGGVHVLTANDYLARRDAEWMGGLYRSLGLTVGSVHQGLTPAERRAAYACDITYLTANEAGFDYLRDGLALHRDDLVQRPFEAALIDEADSILIDEARIPLVIAGGVAPPHNLAVRMARVVPHLAAGHDFRFDEHRRNVYLTDRGLARAEAFAGCSNLYEPAQLAALTALQNAMHATFLLRRDVDYVIKNGRIELVDEFKGRIAENRRWPAGLQTAIEAKEGLALQQQGSILGSITLQNFISLYPMVCGMTGTAVTQEAEFKEFYALDVVPIPTNRPMIRVDESDVVFPTRLDKERAVFREIVDVHDKGRPVLVGTASVAESERLSTHLLRAAIPHEVLNARNDEREAQIVARAGQRGAVTISTNMAGRGTDIPLAGDEVCVLGGLRVIGTNRHEARRIDHQLRGRSGRQGDPGSSRFYISLEDDLIQRYGVAEQLPFHSIGGAIDTVQRIIEDENLQIRRMLRKYESTIEQQRRILYDHRMELLLDGAPASQLHAIDERWADYLAAVEDLRDGIPWVSLGGKDPFPGFIQEATRLFEEVRSSIEENAEEIPDEPVDRGATWTYVINDQPFGSLTDRLVAGLRRRVRDLLAPKQ
ncbi:MAG: accessory Sec system translocase SecA2 [Bryobacteraceae bacterium]|jgi:preprotein translocase subunit SecA